MADDLAKGFEETFGLEGAEPQPEIQAEPVEQSTEPPVETPAVEPEQQQPEAQPEETKELPRVGLDKYLSEREKRQEAQKRADALEARLRELEAKAQPQAKIPDPYEDPEGYDRYVRSSVDQNAWNLRAEMSGRFAEQKYGKETVEAAVAWAQAEGAKDPTLGQRVMAQASPVEWVVEQYNRDQFFQKYGSDPSALTQSQQPSVVAPQAAVPAFQPVTVTPKQAPPPKSLATATSAGAGHQGVPTGSALDSLKFNLG
jgi:hypothetical protein